MKKIRILLFALLAIVAVAIAAGLYWDRKEGADIPPTSNVHKPQNAIYYWRTTYMISDYEYDFMKKHDVRRMYLRMFDVVKGKNMPEPNATVKIIDKPKEGIEIIPTVFITVDAMKQAAKADDGISMLAKKLVKRIKAMCSWHEIENWHEIQLDCDWTTNTQKPFYQLCAKVKKELGKERLLSSTIRLHQLTQEPPPVDYGVLMIYNTDDFSNISTQNSILNNYTVEAYLCKKLKCKLPLDIALPTFQWDIVFRGEKFVRIVRQYEYPDSEDEEVRHEQVPFAELRKTQDLVNRYLHLANGKHSIVLYHLDETNLNNYSDEEFKSLYNH